MKLYKRKDNGIYYVRWGKNRKSLGTKNKKEAEALYALFRADYIRGIHNLPSKPPKITLRDASIEFLRIKSLDLKKGTIRRYLTSFNQIYEYLGNLIVSDIAPENIEVYKNKRRLEISGPTVNRDVTLLKTFFKWAIKQGYASTNPAMEVDSFKEPKKEPNVLSAAESMKLLDACDEPFIRTFIMIALHTGCRLEEILSLKWEHVNFDNRTFLVVFSKRNQDDLIRMNTVLTNYMLSIKRDDGYVVSKSDGSRYQNIRKGWERVVKRAGIKRITPHDLRHTWATLLREAGADLRTLQELGRWSDLKLLERYSHVREQQLRDTVEMICPYLQGNGTEMAHINRKANEERQYK